MRKTILPICACLFLAPPVAAETRVELGGVFRGYAVFTDDRSGVPGRQHADFRRDSEWFIAAERRLDNGLRLGIEGETDWGAGGEASDEITVFAASRWGRIDLGTEDGAAYLLQIALPSADPNLDSTRAEIQAIDTPDRLDYDHNPSGKADKLTYLSPVLSGFRFGLSYTPESGRNAAGNNTAAMGGRKLDIEDVVDVGAVWSGKAWPGRAGEVGLSLGGGYSRYGNVAALGTGETWHVAGRGDLESATGTWSLGAAWLDSQDTGLGNGDVNTFAAGLGWQAGRWNFGISTLRRRDTAPGQDIVGRKTAIGGGYEIADGISFRAAVLEGEAFSAGSARVEDFRQLLFGTHIDF